MKLYKLLTVIFAFVALLSLLIGCSGSTTTDTTATETSSIPSDFRDYSDSTELFSVSYPSQWEPTDTMTTLQSQIKDTINTINGLFPVSYASVVFEAGLKTGSGYYPNFNISVEPSGPGVLNAEDAAEYLIDNLRHSAPDIQVVSQKQITLSGKDAMLVEFKGTFSSGPLMHDLMLVYLNGTNVWTATCTAKDADYSQYANIFDSIVRSFRINLWPAYGV